MSDRPIGRLLLCVGLSFTFSGNVTLFAAQQQSCPGEDPNGPIRLEQAAAATTGSGPGANRLRIDPIDFTPPLLEFKVEADGLSRVGFRDAVLTICFRLQSVTDLCREFLGGDLPKPNGNGEWAMRIGQQLPYQPLAAGVVLTTPGYAISGVAYSSPQARQAVIEGTWEEPDEPMPSVRIVPPQIEGKRKRKVAVLTTSPRIREVVFEVDGQRMAVDEEAPFSARIALPDATANPRLVAIGYDCWGVELARDELAQSPTAPPQNRNMQLHLKGIDSGSVSLEASFDLPESAQVERVDFTFRNRRTQLHEAPYALDLGSVPLEPSDFVAVRARLSDGTTLEDAWLAGAGESIAVTLTELFVVAEEGKGRLATELAAKDLQLTLGRRRVPIEEMIDASELPLTVGLLLDLSASMGDLMDDVRQAATGFLASVLRDQDTTFAIQFASHPQVIHDLTSTHLDLTQDLARARAGGATALYDALVYSTLVFPADGRRRAVVVVTDGRDNSSLFSRAQTVQHLRQAGVVVYIISLSDTEGSLQAGLTSASDMEGIAQQRAELHSLAQATGGRVFQLRDPRKLDTAYQRIRDELTAQLLITFSTSHRLSAKERGQIRLEPVAGKAPRGLRLRFTVGRPAEN